MIKFYHIKLNKNKRNCTIVLMVTNIWTRYCSPLTELMALNTKVYHPALIIHLKKLNCIISGTSEMVKYVLLCNKRN